MARMKPYSLRDQLALVRKDFRWVGEVIARARLKLWQRVFVAVFRLVCAGSRFGRSTLEGSKDDLILQYINDGYNLGFSAHIQDCMVRLQCLQSVCSVFADVPSPVQEVAHIAYHG